MRLCNSGQTVRMLRRLIAYISEPLCIRDISKSTIQAGIPPARASHRSLIAYLAKSRISTPKGRPARGRCSPERLFLSLACIRALHSMAQVWLSRTLHLLFPGTCLAIYGEFLMRKSANSLHMVLRRSFIPYINDIVSEKYKSSRFSLVVRMLLKTRNLESFGSKHHSGRKSAYWHQKVSIWGMLSNPSLHRILDVVIILELVLDPRSTLLKDLGHV